MTVLVSRCAARRPATVQGQESLTLFNEQIVECFDDSPAESTERVVVSRVQINKYNCWVHFPLYVCDNGPRHANSIRRFEQFEDTTAVAVLAWCNPWMLKYERLRQELFKEAPK